MRRCGLDPEQVIWLPLAPSHREHLQQYGQVDVALDCFPNGGCTTTCEALWMGVPVLTCNGDRFASRHAATHLKSVGLDNWIAESTSHFTHNAIEWYENKDTLATLRQELRAKIDGSPLCNHKEYAQALSQYFEKAVQSYRESHTQ